MFVSTCSNSMVSGPVSQTNIVSTMFTCMNYPDMSHVAMSLFSFASMKQDRNIVYVVTVGDLVSYFFF